MPTVVATAMGVASPWVGGVVVATLMLAAAIAVAAFRALAGAAADPVRSRARWRSASRCRLLGIRQQQVAALLAGTVIAGCGLRVDLLRNDARRCCQPPTPHQRAGLLSAFYVQSYLALQPFRRSPRACRSR